jgi:hypothetical protein
VDCGGVGVDVTRQVFDGMAEKGVLMWDLRCECCKEAMELSYRLRGLEVGFGEVRTINVLTACRRFTGFGKKT